MTTSTERHADVWIAAAVFATALLAFLAFDPFDRPLLLDAATWDYMAVQLAEGMIPYRDVFLHKTPGAALLGAVGARTARAFELRPVAGAHAVFLLLGAAAPALLYLLSRRTLSVGASLAAAAFLMAFDQWPVAALEGVRPKVATTTLGLASLVLATRRNWIGSGALGGASTLCWQPGVAFLVGAAWPALQDRERWGALARLAVGAAAVTGLLVAWLGSAGALDDMIAQSVGFNLHYIEINARTPIGTLQKIGRELLRWNAVELLLVPTAVVGLLASRASVPSTLLVAGASYLGMSFVSFQAWPDTILFGAPLACILAAGLCGALSWVYPRRICATLVLGVALSAAAAPRAQRLRPPVTFAEQATAMHRLVDGVAPTDSVLAVSVPELLVHTGRPNRWRWPYMWFGADRFAARHTPGGFQAMLADLERDPPALIVVARRWAGPLRRRFDAWVRPRYEPAQASIYPHTSKPIRVYRLRRP